MQQRCLSGGAEPCKRRRLFAQLQRPDTRGSCMPAAELWSDLLLRGMCLHSCTNSRLTHPPPCSEFQAALGHRADHKSLFLQRIFTLMDSNRDGVMCVVWRGRLMHPDAHSGGRRQACTFPPGHPARSSKGLPPTSPPHTHSPCSSFEEFLVGMSLLAPNAVPEKKMRCAWHSAGAEACSLE